MTRKRVLDLALLLPLVPLFATAVGLLALLVLLIDGRPIFFGQPRLGRARRPFAIWKLRTMTTEPDPNDRRPTRLGAWLRQRGLDELPQLYCVLRGHMSLVGPRPLTAADARASAPPAPPLRPVSPPSPASPASPRSARPKAPPPPPSSTPSTPSAAASPSTSRSSSAPPG
jgi:hypothetical protein